MAELARLSGEHWAIWRSGHRSSWAHAGSFEMAPDARLMGYHQLTLRPPVLCPAPAAKLTFDKVKRKVRKGSTPVHRRLERSARVGAKARGVHARIPSGARAPDEYLAGCNDIYGRGRHSGSLSAHSQKVDTFQPLAASAASFLRSCVLGWPLSWRRPWRAAPTRPREPARWSDSHQIISCAPPARSGLGRPAGRRAHRAADGGAPPCRPRRHGLNRRGAR